MRNVIEKVNSSFDLAVTFFLLVGSLYFIYYSLSTSKPHYLLLSIFLYLLSYIVRSVVLKVHYTEVFTEAGLFFISFLLTAYLLYIIGIDRDIINYLPTEILIQSGSVFVFIILISLISGFKKSLGKFTFISLMVIVLLVTSRYSAYLNTLFLYDKRIANLIMGFPLIYLISQVFGINKFLIDKKKSS